MESSRFDAMSRDFASKMSRVAHRRRLLTVIGMAAVAPLVGSDAGAARATCRAHGAGCTRSAQCCSGVCETSRSLPRRRRNRCYQCVPQCDLGCGEPDGCGGVCPRTDGYYLPGEDACGTAQDYCASDTWHFAGKKALCFPSAEGLVEPLCKKDPNYYHFGYSSCATATDCSAFCAEQADLQRCVCATDRHYYYDGRWVTDSFVGDGNMCIAITGQPYDFLAGDICGD